MWDKVEQTAEQTGINLEKIMEGETNEIKPNNNHGGYRQGAGRKKLAVSPTGNVRKAIEQALRKKPKSLQTIWAKVMEEAEKGSEKHINILFSYYYGKPVEKMEVSAKQLVVKRIIIGTDGSINT